MGLRHSGELVDSAFMNLVGTWAHQAHVRREFQIEAYWRFKDDILMIASCGPSTAKFLEEMKARAKYFKLKLSDLSDKKIRFLDLEITKTTKRFETKVVFKETSVNVPLSRDSAHAPHVRLDGSTHEAPR